MRTISSSSRTSSCSSFSGSEEGNRPIPASPLPMRPLQPSTPLQTPPSSPPALVNHEIWLTKRGGALSTDEARFSVGGPAHKVVISFLDEVLESARMRLAIDGRTVHEVQTRWSFRGNVKLELDGMVVDLVWDMFEWPVWFWFRTRSGDDGVPESDEEEAWEEIEVAHSLVIYGKLN